MVYTHSLLRVECSSENNCSAPRDAYTGFSLAFTISNSTGDSYANVGDWNGDGISDVEIGNGASDTIYYMAYAPEVLTEIDNGIGVQTYVAYNRINAGGSFYTKETGATYPTRDLDGQFYVVSEVDSANGLGTCTGYGGTYCYKSTYAYTGAKSDLQGRGFLGFHTVSITDAQTGIVQTTVYHQDFPYIGLIASQTKSYGSTVLSSTTNNYSYSSASQPLDTGYPATTGQANTYFVFLASSVRSGSDLDGTTLPTVTTTYGNPGSTTGYDAYGDVLQIGVVTQLGSDVASKTTYNTYQAPDTMNWILGRLTAASTTASYSGTSITRSSSFQYFSNGLLSQEVVEPSDSGSMRLQTDYQYDGFGNKTQVQASGFGGSRTTITTWESGKGRFAMGDTNALGQSESWSFDERFGLPTQQQGPNGILSEWSYDGFGRKTSETRFANLGDTNNTQITYNFCVPGGCPGGVAFYATSTPMRAGVQNGPEAIAYYDMLSRAVIMDVQQFNNQSSVCWARTYTVYDGNGRVSQVSQPYFFNYPSGCPTDPQRVTTNTYDALGRAYIVTNPNGGTITTGFHGLSTSVTATVDGNSGDNQTTTTVKNVLGQTKSITDTSNNTTTYNYDAYGDLLAVTDPAGNVSLYYYDTRGRKIFACEPDRVQYVVSVCDGGAGLNDKWSYGYDAFGDLTEQIDANGNNTNLGYDQLGRLTVRIEPGLVSTWAYGTSAANHTRDAHQHVTSEQAQNPSNGSIAISTTRTFDPNTGLVTNITANGAPGSAAALTWTQAASPCAANCWGGASWGTGAAVLANLSYSYDLLGKMTERADAASNNTQYFCYDNLNRITGYNSPDPSCTNETLTVTMFYDALGNVTEKSDVCGSSNCYVYPSAGQPKPHAVSSVVTGSENGVNNPTYTYDNNGNMLTGAGRTMVYTAFNMVAMMTQGTSNLCWGYDADHQRARMDVAPDCSGSSPASTTYYLHDALSGLMEDRVVSGGNTSFTDYLIVGGAIIGTHTQVNSNAPTTTFYVLDSQGSVAVTTSQDGALLCRITYTAFGGSSPSGSSCAAPSREYLSQESINDGALYNLINLNARVFDPVLVRFMGADPVTNPYIPQDLNPYSYGLNSPLWLPDPSGMCSWFIDCIFEGIGNAAASVWNATIGAMIHSGNVFLRHNPLVAETIGTLNEIGAATLCGPCAGAVAATDTAIQGGKTGQIFEAAAISLGEQVAFNVTGSFLQGAGLQENTAAVFVAHGAVGGLASVAQGSNFASGFLAAGVGSLGDSIDAGNLYINVAIHATAGGFGSVLGGGKFENGAITGAYGYLFNYLDHQWAAQSAAAGAVVGGVAAAGGCAAATDGVCIVAGPEAFAAGSAVGGSIGYAMGYAAGEAADQVVDLVHGNSYQSMRPNEVYYLINNTSGAIDKIGCTCDPGGRYSQAYLDAQNVFYETQTQYSSRYPAIVDENIRLYWYRIENGQLPRLNKVTR